MITRRRLLVLLAVGLLVRELLAPWTGHPWDLEVFARIGYYVSSGMDPYIILEPVEGITFAPYGNMTSVGYPPPWPLLCSFSYLIYSFFNAVAGAPAFLYYSLLKQLIIISDLLCALLIFRIISDEKKALWALVFWLFNPLTIILSALWGMFDSLVLMLTLAAVVCLVGLRDKISGAILGFAAALKIIPVIYAPIFILFSRRKIQFLAVFAASLAFFVFAPFLFFGWPLEGFFNAMFSQAVNVRDTPAFGGLTPFSLLGYLLQRFPDAVPGWLLTVLNYLWLAVFSIFFIAIWAHGFRQRNNIEPFGRPHPELARYGQFETFMRLSIIASLLFLLTRTWVSESYVIYLLAFMLIDVMVFHTDYKKWFLLAWAIALSYLITANTLLIRFFTPIVPSAFYLDLYINNTPPTSSIRYALMFIMSLAFYLVAIRILLLYLKRDGWVQSKKGRQLQGKSR